MIQSASAFFFLFPRNRFRKICNESFYANWQFFKSFRLLFFSCHFFRKKAFRDFTRIKFWNAEMLFLLCVFTFKSQIKASTKKRKKKGSNSSQYFHNFSYFYRWSRHSWKMNLLQFIEGFSHTAICKKKRKKKLKYLCVVAFFVFKTLFAWYTIHNNVTGIQQQILSVDDRKPISLYLCVSCRKNGWFFVKSSFSSKKLLHNNFPFSRSLLSLNRHPLSWPCTFFFFSGLLCVFPPS